MRAARLGGTAVPAAPGVAVAGKPAGWVWRRARFHSSQESSLAQTAPGFNGLLTTSPAANRPRRRDPNTSTDHSIGRSDGRCVQRAGT
ncbi:hypothetical protein QJS10_CPA08g00793 [Acorus calamus]|uniref:Uncharacterized protein n=1 Tax=Acorus calamus TaxID=4465 RepID=A0AAV9ECZ6_ACOCL|nr:hypothetical protein QJS10_CPA08g00793 [Acorus calamus]